MIEVFKEIFREAKGDGYFWCEGNNYLSALLEADTYPFQEVIHWRKLCEFSQEFSNPPFEKTEFKDDLLYISSDSIGVRARFTLNHGIVIRVKPYYQDTSYEKIASVSKEVCLTNDFGSEYARDQELPSYTGFSWSNHHCYFFESCNGNKLFAFPKGFTRKFNVFISSTECNYARFFNTQKP